MLYCRIYLFIYLFLPVGDLFRPVWCAQMFVRPNINIPCSGFIASADALCPFPPRERPFINNALCLDLSVGSVLPWWEHITVKGGLRGPADYSALDWQKRWKNHYWVRAGGVLLPLISVVLSFGGWGLGGILSNFVYEHSVILQKVCRKEITALKRR